MGWTELGLILERIGERIRMAKSDGQPLHLDYPAALDHSMNELTDSTICYSDMSEGTPRCITRS